MRANLRRWLLGRPLHDDEARRQSLGVVTGIPFLGLDALASAAYGPEAALAVLSPAGEAGLRYVVVLGAAVVALLILVQLSYRQTITCYPDGGGAYSVVSRNLGTGPGLVAGAALWIDYVLNVAVGISAGVGALTSAAPPLLAYRLVLCLAILIVLTLLNLRGVRDSGRAFTVPTYLFVACLGTVVVMGLVQGLSGTATPRVVPPRLPAAVMAPTAWLLLRAFASGCTAMTGVEAVSNAVPVFGEPRVVRARRTLAAITGILAVLVLGVTYLSVTFHVGATAPDQAGFQSVLSQVTGAVLGRGSFYYATMGAVTAVLCLSANTSFADFPRLCRMLARDRFLPDGFAHQGPRLVYGRGIVLLAVLAGLLLIAFRGITDRLIPLFAVGAFLAFTLSQFGMVAHWRRQRGNRRRALGLLVNGAGACATAVTLAIIVVAKFTEGAWVTVLVLLVLLRWFGFVKARARWRARRIGDPPPLHPEKLRPPLVVVPLKRLDRVTAQALGFALSISNDVTAVQLLTSDVGEADLSAVWPTLVEVPCRQSGVPPPRLMVLVSAYREVVEPLVRHVRRLAVVNPERTVAVVLSELVERRWYHFLLRDNTARVLEARLRREGTAGIIVVDCPWHADEPVAAPAPRKES